MRPKVIEVLSKVSLVVHTLVPEKYRFWTSNQQGVCCHPVAICPGPLGSILALDYDLHTCCSRLLHQPADVAELQNGLKDSRDLCFSRGVAYIAEHGYASRFEDLDGNVRLNPNSLRSRADLERTLMYRFRSLQLYVWPVTTCYCLLKMVTKLFIRFSWNGKGLQ